MTAELFAIIAPVFFGASVGFVWAKLDQPYDTALVTQLLTTVTTPCLVFSRISVLEVEAGAFGEIAGAAILAFCIFAAAGYAAIKLLGLSVSDFLPPITFPNCGNMGLALCYFAYGDVGLALGIGVFVVGATSQFALSPTIASGRFSLGQVARSPLIYATALSVIVLVTQLHVPAWLLNTTTLLGNISIPLMLITLGVSLARLQVTSLKHSAMVAVLRLVIGFATGLLIVTLFGFTGHERGVVLIMCAMPAAVFNYLFAQKYGQRAEEVAGVVVISTAISFATLPALLWFVLD